MLEVERALVVPSPDAVALAPDVEPPAECVVVGLPPTLVEELTLPPPAVTVVELPASVTLVLSMIVHVVPSSSFIVSARAAPHRETPNAVVKIFRIIVILLQRPAA
ncbi:MULTISPECIES: hypothetical protein [unclassified Rhizobium]|uniref:hypothetical protein n=1 Tax=Rhizobium sp. Leaf386 TaxID=1736359 RepID=UPI0007147FB5|nr:hypothetical protein ASG50_15750 [Rhizobium sp. Leaf386]KQT05085.1 hypothetical protein ASG42_21400 [Rhizobium sp. Leaf391]KQU02072.1 hypothetical protein ASG68_27915 [Rhizobium sp. Leaf453]